MSPAQLAQIHLRLDKVAAQRAEQAAAMVDAQPVPRKGRLAKQPGKPVTHAKSVREKPAKSSADRVAKHRAANLDAVRAKDRARKGAKKAGA